MRRLALIAALCAVTAVTLGCASPVVRLYTLSPVAMPTIPPAPKPATLSVVVGPVSIPAILNQPQMVVTMGPNQVAVDEFNRWASPLADDISRVVAQDLVAMLGTPRVSLFQQTLNAGADYRVAIEVQGFESEPGVAATLNAAWTVRRSRDGKTEAGRTAVREATGGAGFEALAAAHSRALGRLSQDIAGAIGAIDKSAP
jgi:hypothetical protein